MYTLINRHIGELLQRINWDRDVLPYVTLMADVERADIADSQDFRRRYRAYWEMNQARLCDEFYNAYFGLLAHLRTGSLVNVEVEAVARALLKVPAHNNGRHALQFSFASKMVHMLRPNRPIYDNMVKRFYFLPEHGNREVNERLRGLLRSYEFLVGEYQRILGEGLLAPAIDEFRAHFPVGPEYSDQRVIDTLIWAFVRFLRSGAVCDGVVMYA